MTKFLICSAFLLAFVSLQAQERATELVPVPSLNDEDSNVPIAIVEQIPLFEACKELDKSMHRECFNQMINKHIAENFNYPDEAIKQKIGGRVFVNFIIDKEGKVTDISTRGEAILCQEAERIIKLLPQFIPGQMRGKNVTVAFSIPINFRLD
jgi:periplasmic protein TonB